MNDLNKKVEQSGNSAISTFEQGSSLSNPLKQGHKGKNPKVVELEQHSRKNVKKDTMTSSLNTDDQIITLYETFIKPQRSVRFKPTEYTLNTLRAYLKEKKTSLSDLILDDYGSIAQRLVLIEYIPNRHYSATEIRRMLRYLVLFENWLFQENHITRTYLDHWTYEKLKDLAHKKLSDFKAHKAKRSRHYHPSELIKAYKRHLQHKRKSWECFNRAIKHLNFFLQYLLLNKKSIYTTSKLTVEYFKIYMINYEYKPNHHYQIQHQLEAIQTIKRFYDWLNHERYLDHHPFVPFKTGSYTRWLKENVKVNLRFEQEACWHDVLLTEFEHYEAMKNFCRKTILSHKKGCRHFFEYLSELGIEDMKDVDKETIRGYTNYISQLKNHKGDKLSTNTQLRLLAGVKNLLVYMEKYGLIDQLLSAAVEYPKTAQGLPTPGFTNQEAKILIESATGNTPQSLRDRVFFELLYSSGMRSNELCHLKTKNIDLNRGLVRIDVPKGGIQYERVVPIGRRTCHWIKRFIKEVRYKQAQSEYLFLSKTNRPYSTQIILNAVKAHLMKLPFKKKRIITHSFRVSCGTEMLRRGANVKIVQEQLGHKKITSTERYLRLVPNDLKKAHSKYHPRS